MKQEKKSKKDMQVYVAVLMALHLQHPFWDGNMNFIVRLTNFADKF